MELGILLGPIYLIQVFDQIDVMTGGGPGSTNVPVLRLPALDRRRLGVSAQASAYAIVVVIASIIIATFALRVLSGLLKGEEERMSGRARGTTLGVGERRCGQRSASASLAWVVGLLFFFPVFWMVLNELQGGAGREHEPRSCFFTSRPSIATAT